MAQSVAFLIQCYLDKMAVWLLFNRISHPKTGLAFLFSLALLLSLSFRLRVSLAEIALKLTQKLCVFRTQKTVLINGTAYSVNVEQANKRDGDTECYREKSLLLQLFNMFRIFLLYENHVSAIKHITNGDVQAFEAAVVVVFVVVFLSFHWMHELHAARCIHKCSMFRPKRQYLQLTISLSAVRCIDVSILISLVIIRTANSVLNNYHFARYRQTVAAIGSRNKNYERRSAYDRANKALN